MKKLKRFYKALGRNEVGGINFPSKMSNIQISRIRYGDLQGCSFCFPHGWENSNATQKNYQRNWKRFRKKQWKENTIKECRSSVLLRPHLGEE